MEGAFLIPIILLMLMLLIQPGIILYDRTVMSSAAAEACRLIATGTEEDGGQEAFESFVRRRLGAIPQQDNFHVHSTGCTWVIEFMGDEHSQQVTVSIETQIKPLPFFDFGAAALGLVNDSGNFVQRVEETCVVRSEWIATGEAGINPEAWIEANKPE